MLHGVDAWSMRQNNINKIQAIESIEVFNIQMEIKDSVGRITIMEVLTEVNNIRAAADRTIVGMTF